jgi:hypothetical protein
MLDPGKYKDPYSKISDKEVAKCEQAAGWELSAACPLNKKRS